MLTGIDPHAVRELLRVLAFVGVVVVCVRLRPWRLLRLLARRG